MLFIEAILLQIDDKQFILAMFFPIHLAHTQPIISLDRTNFLFYTKGCLYTTCNIKL